MRGSEGSHAHLLCVTVPTAALGMVAPLPHSADEWGGHTPASGPAGNEPESLHSSQRAREVLASAASPVGQPVGQDSPPSPPASPPLLPVARCAGPSSCDITATQQARLLMQAPGPGPPVTTHCGTGGLSLLCGCWPRGLPGVCQACEEPWAGPSACWGLVSGSSSCLALTSGLEL